MRLRELVVPTLTAAFAGGLGLGASGCWVPRHFDVEAEYESAEIGEIVAHHEPGGALDEGDCHRLCFTAVKRIHPRMVSLTQLETCNLGPAQEHDGVWIHCAGKYTTMRSSPG